MKPVVLDTATFVPGDYGTSEEIMAGSGRQTETRRRAEGNDKPNPLDRYARCRTR